MANLSDTLSRPRSGLRHMLYRTCNTTRTVTSLHRHLCKTGTWAFVNQTSSSNFEVALATALVSLLRYIREGGLPIAKPTVARFLPDKTFSTSGGYMVGVYLPGVTEVHLLLLHAFNISVAA